jgi:hypothetical protein
MRRNMPLLSHGQTSWVIWYRSFGIAATTAAKSLSTLWLPELRVRRRNRETRILRIGALTNALCALTLAR